MRKIPKKQKQPFQKKEPKEAKLDEIIKRENQSADPIKKPSGLARPATPPQGVKTSQSSVLQNLRSDIEKQMMKLKNEAKQLRQNK
jgi:hypothetical protein